MMAEHGGELSFETLSKMDVLQRNIQEALRIHPPLILLLRYAKESFTVTTSKGKQVVVPKVSRSQAPLMQSCTHVACSHVVMYSCSLLSCSHVLM